MDNSYGLLKVQTANLYILNEIKRICNKYNLKYVLDSGTLLGAIRHSGFIPWDDDVDIAMTRANFEIFRKIAKKELAQDLELVLPKELARNNVFYDFTPRIILKRSNKHLDENENNFYLNKLNHLWVDIFILDALPNISFLAKLIKFKHKIIYLLSMGHRYKINYKKYSLIQKILVFSGSNIGKFIPMIYLYNIQNLLSKMFNKEKNKKFYYSNYQPDYLYVDLDSKIVNSIIEIKFEDELYNIPENYDEVLKKLYGNYMKLPKKENRKPTHSSENIEIYE